MSAIFSALETLFKYAKTPDDLNKLITGLQKISRCNEGVKQGLCLSDIVNDQKNYQSLRAVFGPHTPQALLAIANYSLQDVRHRSFVLNKGIAARRGAYLYRAMGGWKQFQITLICTIMDEDSSFDVRVINTASRADWEAMRSWPEGTLVSVYLKTVKGECTQDQEYAAIDRVIELLDAVQFLPDEKPEPRAEPNNKARKPVSRPAQRVEAYDTTNPIFTFDVRVNKLDTFVHAGNAALIAKHVRQYKGQITMTVIREKFEKVVINSDSIWAAGIRNGEVIRYDFFGAEAPTDDFVKALAQVTNKYTQMDKVG